MRKNPPGTVVCIVCMNIFPISDKQSYLALKHFEDSCFCNDCLSHERNGWEIREEEHESAPQVRLSDQSSRHQA